MTKSDGSYFHKLDRIWREAAQTGVAPFFVGDWGKKGQLPDAPTRDVVKALCDGKAYLGRVQGNRVGCYDLTFTFDKTISIGLYGLTPLSGWKASAEKFVDATRPSVEKLVERQRANSGAQGKHTLPSQGGAIGFLHWKSWQNDPHAHIHYAIPNLTATKAGKFGSIAKVKENLYDAQGLLRAAANKRLDDILQADGFVTARRGTNVVLPGIPEKMVAELSAARRAMNAAKKQKRFSGPRAHDHYARQARRDAGKQAAQTPHELTERVKRVAQKYDVTVEKLKHPPGTPVAARDKYTAMSTAYDVAIEARDYCAAKYGSFTVAQFQERLYTFGIGRSTTFDALDDMGRVAVSKQQFLNITRHKMPDGTVRLTAPKSEEVRREAERPFRPDTAAAWAELKKAARGLGEAVLVKTVSAGVEVVRRLSEAVNPTPKMVSIEVKDLPKFIEGHNPTNYFLAHAKALFRGALAPGSPHEKAAAAEKVYASLRQHSRLSKNTVLVVEGARYATARELHQLAKIARRDGACVVLSDRPDRAGNPGRERNWTDQRQTHERHH